jgi:hypothetical protein
MSTRSAKDTALLDLAGPEGAGGIDLGIHFPRVKRSIAERPSPMRIVLLSPAGFVFRPAPSTLMHRRATMPMTREEIVSVLGPTDETLVADMLSTGASVEELREAWAWLNEDEALMGEGRALPGTRVAELINLLDADEDD